MAVTFIQWQNSQTSGAVSVVTFSSNTGAGNTIVVHALADHSFVSGPFDPNFILTVTDTQGNIYTAVAAHLYSQNGANVSADSQVFVASNILGGPNTVIVTTSGGSVAVRSTYNTAAEYTGNPAVNPLVGFNTNVAFSGDLGVSLTTTQTNQMVVLMGLISGTPPVGFTTHNTGGYWDKSIAAATTATYTITATLGTGETLWGIVLTDTPGTSAKKSYVFEM